MSDDRPKPASFGFDMDFSDLSKVQPASKAAGRPSASKKPARPTSAAKPAAVKATHTKTKKTGPKSQASKSQAPKLAEPQDYQNQSASKPEVLKQQDAIADKLAQSMGFESREQKMPVLKKRRRTHHDEPVDQLSIRGPVRVLNDFITFCEAEHLSYWEGMERLLEK